MYYRFYLVVLLVLSIASNALAKDEYTIKTDPVTKEHYFLFKSSRGNVRFNHDLHKVNMKTESCLPCHKTDKPTKEHMMSRFDERVAHYFCKGCHREKGRGPVECHQCHKGS
ncbi:MAG: cytochrome c3 family protein [Desulfuromonadaceae bacterium]|nr:cytochrome c3 family protein [Desulfuromonadaceae bacterium]MDD2854828.1 cytochrome c3 family protein [Desulfuromonadaceae bacterium]